jgi:uracil-DNA glycosylase
MKFKTLRELHTYYHEHCACVLKKTATQPVFGDGSNTADVVFIGEAPGKKEDQTGTPFVGAAGKFLNEMLNQAGLSRTDVYITNIVKYRPPNNRDPEPQEKLDCTPWLIEELKFIKPKLVVFLGRHSMGNFFPEAKIGDVHGTLLRKEIIGMPTDAFMPLYHPASALYNPGSRPTLIEDMKKIPGVLKKLAKEKPTSE